MSSGVDCEGSVVITNLLDETLGVKISDKLSSNGSIDLELIAHFGNSDGQELRSILHNSIVSLSVEENCIVKLFLYFCLGPTLLFSLTTGLLSWEGSLGRLTLISLGILPLGILLLCL